MGGQISRATQAKTMTADNVTKGKHLNIQRQSLSVESHLKTVREQSLFPLQKKESRVAVDSIEHSAEIEQDENAGGSRSQQLKEGHG